MKRILLVVSIALLLGSAGQPARAQANVAITDLQVKVRLQNNGSALIEQQLNYAEPTQLNWTIFSKLTDLSVIADDSVVPTGQIQHRHQGDQTLLVSSATAQSWQLNYTTTSVLIRHHDRDQFYLKIFNNPGGQIYNALAVFDLPETASSNDLGGNLYAIGGVLDPVSQKTSNQEMVYTVSSAGPQSLFTVSANWPKSVLALSQWQEWRLDLLNLDALPWLILGLILPLLALAVLVELQVKRRQSEHDTTAQIDTLPSSLPSILVGVIVNKKIYPNEIVSLLVDLCQRGYVVIVKKNSTYSLSLRRAPDEHLHPWEKEILDQLFDNQKGQANIQSVNQSSLFSPQVRDAFAQIYQVITELEIFAENPHLTRVRYKLIALSFYFFGVIGLIWTAISGSSPYLIIPLTSTIVIAYLIIRLCPKLIRYTKNGLVIRGQWLAFGNYLRAQTQLPISASQNRLFEKYLPYAIALHLTTEWASRFDTSTLAILKPDWLISYQDGSTLELAQELVGFTKIISEEITKLRGPLVN